MAKDQVKVLPLISIFQTDCGPRQSREKDIEYRNNNETEWKELFSKTALRRAPGPLSLLKKVSNFRVSHIYERRGVHPKL